MGGRERARVSAFTSFSGTVVDKDVYIVPMSCEFDSFFILDFTFIFILRPSYTLIYSTEQESENNKNKKKIPILASINSTQARSKLMSFIRTTAAVAVVVEGGAVEADDSNG